MGRVVQGPSPGLGQAAPDFNHPQWLLEHTSLVKELISDWTADGYEVGVEGQNAFALEGVTATLAGRADLVAWRDNETVVIDAKTGQESPSHLDQVVIYLYAVPRTLPRHRESRNGGRVAYRDRKVSIPARPWTRSSGGTWGR